MSKYRHEGGVHRVEIVMEKEFRAESEYDGGGEGRGLSKDLFSFEMQVQ